MDGGRIRKSQFCTCVLINWDDRTGRYLKTEAVKKSHAWTRLDIHNNGKGLSLHKNGS